MSSYYHHSELMEDIEVIVPAGKTIALVGKTGAGKSTLVKLISRFYDPTEGQITIDGYDLRQVRQESVRRQMGIVLQDPFLFSGTVRENIRFGNLYASDEEVEIAARAVGAHDFIRRLRRGYDTKVEEGGVLLSVGQRQLISFARALLADPRILILDDTTSFVDTETEYHIQKALEALLQNRTTFVITQRLSTIKNADKIIVLENGEIAESGSHEELLSKNGIYTKIYRTQFAPQEEHLAQKIEGRG